MYCGPCTCYTFGVDFLWPLIDRENHRLMIMTDEPFPGGKSGGDLTSRSCKKKGVSLTKTYLACFR